MHAWGLLMVGLIMSSHINSGIASRTYAYEPQEQIYQQKQQSHLQQQYQTTNDVSEYRSLQHLQVVNFSVQSILTGVVWSFRILEDEFLHFVWFQLMLILHEIPETLYLKSKFFSQQSNKL